MVNFDLNTFLTLRNALRLVMVVVLFGYTIHAFLVMMRIRILAKTLKSKNSPLVYNLARIHFFAVLISSVIVLLLILL